MLVTCTNKYQVKYHVTHKKQALKSRHIVEVPPTLSGIVFNNLPWETFYTANIDIGNA